MPLYLYSTSHVCRKTGRSAVGRVAYVAGVSLVDARTGLLRNFKRKGGVLLSHLVLPDGSFADHLREALWNSAEAAEKRKDSRVAREILVAIPCELTGHERKDLALQFARNLAADWGVPIDFALHRPDRRGDERNFHLHVTAVVRNVELTNGAFCFGEKLPHEKSETDRKKAGLADIATWLRCQRKGWEELVNIHLEKAGVIARVDCRSLNAQGIDRHPTVHLGPALVAIERGSRGSVPTKTRAGEYNRGIWRQDHDKERLQQAKRRKKMDGPDEGGGEQPLRASHGEPGSSGTTPDRGPSQFFRVEDPAIAGQIGPTSPGPSAPAPALAADGHIEGPNSELRRYLLPSSRPSVGDNLGALAGRDNVFGLSVSLRSILRQGGMGRLGERPPIDLGVPRRSSASIFCEVDGGCAFLAGWRETWSSPGFISPERPNGAASKNIGERSTLVDPVWGGWAARVRPARGNRSDLEPLGACGGRWRQPLDLGPILLGDEAVRPGSGPASIVITRTSTMFKSILEFIGLSAFIPGGLRNKTKLESFD